MSNNKVEQRKLGLELSDKKGLLREMILPTVYVRDNAECDRSGVPIDPVWKGVSAKSMRLVLNNLLNRAGNKAWAFPAGRTIAKDTDLCHATVGRVIKALKQLELVIVKEMKTPRGSVCNHYHILWTELETYCPKKSRGRVRATSYVHPAEREPTSSNAASPKEEFAHATATNHAHPGTISLAHLGTEDAHPGNELAHPGNELAHPGSTELLMNSSMNPPPEGPNREATWKKVEDVLSRAGMKAASHCAQLAQKRGYTPAAVLALHDYWAGRPGAWDVGAIFTRIQACPPEMPIADGWPKPNADFAESERRQIDRHAKQQANERRRSKAAHAAAERQAETEAATKREERYGPQLDSMTAQERDQLAATLIDANPYLRRWYRDEEWKAPQSTIRVALLIELERRAAEKP